MVPRWFALCVLLGVLIVAGCGSDDSSESSSGDQSSEQGGPPIKIGASLPLTGEFSEPGKAAQQGYKVWEAMTNEGEGLLGRKVEFRSVTTRATRTRSSRTTRR